MLGDLILIIVLIGVICGCLIVGEGVFDFLYAHIPGFREVWENYVSDKCEPDESEG